MRGWRSMRQAIAAMRQQLRGRGGARIVLHRENCAVNDGEPCNCRPRYWLVRSR